MKITLCGSTAFFDEIKGIKQQLTNMGHEVYLTPWANLSFEEVMARRSDKDKYFNDYKPYLFRAHFDKILKSDAILVINLEKNGIENYIGGNTFAEVMFAYYHKKKIFFLNPIPRHEMFFYIMDELKVVKPIVINGNLDLIM